MSTKDEFVQQIQKGYSFKGEHVKLGCGMLNGEAVSNADVILPLKTRNIK
jgi:uncharacterized protein